jgi:TetR/AcrR family transcriptional regulator, regulator of autoinduction and epiphytic fitness
MKMNEKNAAFEEVNLSRSERKRSAILSAAVSEFRKLGYSVATIDSIAKMAGVSKPTIYSHFGNKERLFEEVLDDLIDSIESPISSIAYNKDLSFEEQLKNITSRYASFFSSDKVLDLCRITISEALMCPELVQKVYSRIVQLIDQKYLSKLLQTAMDNEKGLSIDSEAFALQLIASIKEQFFWPRLFCSEPPEIEIVDQPIIQMQRDNQGDCEINVDLGKMIENIWYGSEK